ncbi:hypothetical protein SAMN05446037_100170 [Anaerovirgula multivorans]|uniref:Uncharacterized protein n=1 Tax=Anaerovirgula multivorans TaxID=312168 RepID=A0A238ZRZ0_9FIRM|nr:hypothetical protein [Anaerovirgula multivorans]SNR86100.1 hypothetical protein SAMN05446037_100170 [Anaerovirgula multivorans]
MVKVYLSINNNEEILLLPVTPPELEIKESWTNTEVEGMYQNLNLILNKNLSSIELNSFFPVRDYPFLHNRDLWGMEYVEKIKTWQERRFSIRLVVTQEGKTIINMPATIDSFSYSIGKDKDVYYSLSLKQFTFIKVE